MRQAGEPTVEEILESIKKVIARDNRVGAAEERRFRETSGMAAESSDRFQQQHADHGDDADHDEDVLDLSGSQELGDHDDDADPEETPLLNHDALASMRESLATLAMLAEPGAPPQIVRSGETSLEGMARELLRPALAAWLDKHLPQIVERMVAIEIARIVGKRG